MRTWQSIAELVAAATVATICVFVLARTVDAKPGPDLNSMTVYDAIVACDELRYSGESSVNCVVTYVQGHPTLAVEFANEPSMNADLGEISKRIAHPFCEAANKDKERAFFVVALKTPRMGSVSSCETGESSGWVLLDSASHSN